MMEVVIAFSHCKDRRKEMISGRKCIVIRRRTEVMGNRINTKSALYCRRQEKLSRRKVMQLLNMVGNSQPRRSSKTDTTQPVVPSPSRDRHRHDQAPDHGQREIPIMLPFQEHVIFQIAHVDITYLSSFFRLGFHQHPPNVCP